MRESTIDYIKGVGISVILGLGIVYLVWIGLEFERKHPCIEYGEEKIETAYIVIGHIAVPSTRKYRDCLMREGE